MRKGNSASNLESLFGAKRGESLSTGHRLVDRGTVAPDLSRPQPRSRFTAIELEGLASSIRALRERGEGTGATGIIQSLIVRISTPKDVEFWESMIANPDCPIEYKNIVPNQISYILLAGERRWRAAGIAGQNNLPIVVTQTAAKGALLLQVIENDQRQDLSPLEKAKAYARLRDENQLSIRDVAAAIGKTRGYVTNRLDLLKMGEDLQEMVSSREDTLKHAALINPVEIPELRSELIRQVLEADASVAEIRRQIEKVMADVQSDDQTAEVTSEQNPTTPIISESPVRNSVTALHHLELGVSHLVKSKHSLNSNSVISTSDKKTIKQLLAEAESNLQYLQNYFEKN